MKHVFMSLSAAFALLNVLSATSVVTKLVPLVVEVTDQSTGLPIRGTTAQMKCALLPGWIKYEVDEKLRQTYELASKAAQCDELGYALQYCVASPEIDSDGKPTRLCIKGTLIVSANGYVSKSVPIDAVVTLDEKGGVGQTPIAKIVLSAVETPRK